LALNPFPHHWQISGLSPTIETKDRYRYYLCNKETQRINYRTQLLIFGTDKQTTQNFFLKKVTLCCQNRGKKEEKRISKDKKIVFANVSDP
jgi:hypothetical protein